MGYKLPTLLMQRSRTAFLNREISLKDFLKIRIALRNPAIVARLETELKNELVKLNKISNNIEISAIDWNAVIDFIEKLIPLIIKIIDLFS